MFASCSNGPKSADFTAIKAGMKKGEVIKLVGNPEKETNLIMVAMLKYPAQGKIIVLNSDTVVQVLDDSSRVNTLKK